MTVAAALIGGVLLSTAPPAPPTQTPSPAPAPSTLRVHYHCTAAINLARSSATVTIEKNFQEDGSAALNVEWRDAHGQAISGLAGRNNMTVSLGWSGGFRPAAAQYDWSRGMLNVDVQGEGTRARSGLQHDEIWRQYLIDRNSSLQVLRDSSGLYLYLPQAMAFASEVLPLTSPPTLHSPLDGLMALGAGGARITVYETLVTVHRQRRGEGIYNPVSRRRIVVSYDLDVAAIARAADEARAAVEAWEAGLGDFRACERIVEDPEAEQNIVVT